MRTDIPNGFVVAGPDGNPILIDFDDNGKAKDCGHELEVPVNWLPFTRKDGIFREEVLVLVHYIEGEKYLVKALEVNVMNDNGRDVSVFELADRKLLQGTAEMIRDRYMKTKVLT